MCFIKIIESFIYNLDIIANNDKIFSLQIINIFVVRSSPFVLYVVSILIKRVLKEIRENKGDILQVILLTHNVFFHKEVSFIDGRTKRTKNTIRRVL